MFFLNRTLEKPKNADLLIETESELRKVTWPTIDETIDGSIVVMAVVLFLMAFMAGADFVLGEIFTRIITGALSLTADSGEQRTIERWPSSGTSSVVSRGAKSGSATTPFAASRSRVWMTSCPRC